MLLTLISCPAATALLMTEATRDPPPGGVGLVPAQRGLRLASGLVDLLALGRGQVFQPGLDAGDKSPDRGDLLRGGDGLGPCPLVDLARTAAPRSHRDSNNYYQ